MDSGPGPDLTIVLLGHTGVGKSSSGNTILGREAFESKTSFKSVTTEICERTGKVFGKLISVVDTPGILQQQDTKEQIKTCCLQVLQSCRPCLFLVVVSVTRFTKEQETAVRKTIQVLGDDGLQKSYMLFTSGDALDKISVHDFIFEDEKGSLPDIVKRFAGYHLFNNEDKEREQVRELLKKSGHLQTSKHRPDLPGPSAGEFFRLEEMRLVLIGLPESGKSSSGNTILGSNQFRSERRFEAVGTETVSASAEVEGRRLTVVDSPGLADEVQTETQLCEQITKTIAEAGPGPHAVVIVVKIGRISRADSDLLKMLLNLLSRGAQKFTVVLFTHGDELRGQSINQKIQSSPSVSELVSVCGNRYCVFDNRGRKSRRQVQNLMRTIDEMVTANGGRYCTSHTFRTAETFIRGAEPAHRPLQRFDCCWRICAFLAACCCCTCCTCCISGSAEERHPLLQRNYGTLTDTDTN